MNKRIIKIIFSIFLSIVFLFFIFRIINFNDLKLVFEIPLKTLFFCFFLYAFSNIFRALRFKMFLNMNLLEVIGMTFIHNMMNNVLPLRTGELSILFLSKEKKLKSLGSLFYSRIFDVLAITTLLFVSLFFSNIEKKFFFASELLVAFILIGFLFLFIIIKFEFYKILHKINFLKNSEKVNFFISKIDEAKKIINIKKAITLYFLSLLIWIFNFYIAYLIISFLGIHLRWYEIIFTFTFTTLISLLPIHGFMGLGTLEVGWAFILVMFNVSKENALISGFLFHLVNILFFLILGFAGLLFYFFKNLKLRKLKKKNKFIQKNFLF